MFGRTAANARRRRLLAWLGIGLFVVRSIVPIGFMVSAGASGAAVALCPDYAPVPPAALHAHHHSHHHAQQDAGAGGPSAPAHLAGAQDHGLCPFAAAAVPASQGPKPVLAPAVSDPRHPFDRAASDAAIVRLLLATSRSPRGPPALTPG